MSKGNELLLKCRILFLGGGGGVVMMMMMVMVMVMVTGAVDYVGRDDY